jgi:hypothetical protein
MLSPGFSRVKDPPLCNNQSYSMHGLFKTKPMYNSFRGASMEQSKPERFIVQVVEGSPRGDLYELEQATFFHVIDTTTDQIILSFRGDMEASLSRETAQWEDAQYSGVRQVSISEDQQTVLVEYYDGKQELVNLTGIASD